MSVTLSQTRQANFFRVFFILISPLTLHSLEQYWNESSLSDRNLTSQNSHCG